MHETVVHVSAKSHGSSGQMRLKVILVQIEFITDEGGNRGVVEIGEKAGENEVSFVQPFVVRILADGAIEDLSWIKGEGRMGKDRIVEERFEPFSVIQSAVGCLEPGTGGVVVPELLELLQ